MTTGRISLAALAVVFGLAAAAGAEAARRPPEEQIQAYNCDFDDNIMCTGAKIMVWDDVKRREVGLTTAEWAAMRDGLGKDGPWKRFELPPDGLRFFTDDTEAGAGLFRQQVQEALARPDGSWKGPSWAAFVEAMRDPVKRRHTTIITARLHAPDSVLAGLELLREKGLVAGVPPRENVFSVGWPGLPARFKGATTSESKAKVMAWLLDRLERQPVPRRAFLVDDQDGTARARLHLWGFTDDDYANFSKAVAALSAQVKAGRWPHVKVVVFFTGRNHPTQKPHAVVIKRDGTLRPPKATEAVRMRGEEP